MTPDIQEQRAFTDRPPECLSRTRGNHKIATNVGTKAVLNGIEDEEGSGYGDVNKDGRDEFFSSLGSKSGNCATN